MQKPTADNCFDQFKLKKQLFQEIDDLSTQTETQQYFEDPWMIMKSLLTNVKSSAEYEIMSIFGPNAYLAKSYK